MDIGRYKFLLCIKGTVLSLFQIHKILNISIFPTQYRLGLFKESYKEIYMILVKIKHKKG